MTTPLLPASRSVLGAIAWFLPPALGEPNDGNDQPVPSPIPAPDDDRATRASNEPPGLAAAPNGEPSRAGVPTEVATNEVSARASEGTAGTGPDDPIVPTASP